MYICAKVLERAPSFKEVYLVADASDKVAVLVEGLPPLEVGQSYFMQVTLFDFFA